MNPGAEPALSPELRALRDLVRRFLADACPMDAVFAVMETGAGYDAGLWRTMGDQLGLPGLLVPEQYGGSGSGLVAVTVAAEQLGYAVAPGPFLASAVLAVSALVEGADEATRRRWLPGLAAGTTLGAVAVAEHGGEWDTTTGAGTVARRGQDGEWLITGRKEFVLDGHVADVLLVIATGDQGPALYAVDPEQDTVLVTRDPTLDQTRRLATVELTNAPASLIGPPERADAAIRRAHAAAMITLAAESLGGAQRCLDDAVTYAKTRVQFGQPIGGFQAIKHHCANVLVKVEAARSAVRYTACAADAGSAELAILAAGCLLACTEAYSFAAERNIQIHGGIGFTWEHSAHLHFKRAHLTAHLLGGDTPRWELLARHVTELAVEAAAGYHREPDIEPFGELREFRHELRRWIAANADPKLAEITDWNAMPSGDGGQRSERLLDLTGDPLYRRWADTLLEANLICPHWPAEFGGRGWDARRMAVYVEECHRAGVPRVNRGIAEAVVGPSIIGHGTPEQRDRLLPRIISGRDVYCQGFSEPDHGSDLAGIRTRGVVDGDDLVITGKKIWTTYANRANMIFILCRTDPDVPKHKGLTYVISEFSPGPAMQVRPVRQMTGAQDFSEEFIDGLRVPLANVIGGLNNGWRVAMTSLGGERSSRATGQQLARARELLELVDVAQTNGIVEDPLLRRRLAWCYSQTETLRFCRLRMLGDDPGVTPDIWKLQWSEYHQRLSEIAMEIVGARSAIRPAGPEYLTDRWQDTWLAARAATIYAGTSEIQRNILAERVLGLPR